MPDANVELVVPPKEAESWREVQEAVREGEKLSAPDPEPYFSRAEIWSRRFENQQEALLDTLRGIDALLQSSEAGDPIENEKALQKLRAAAWRSLQRPKTIYPGAAESHFSVGLHALRNGEYGVASSHFTRAIQLDATRPQYFYFRALALRSLGDERAATVDAENGASIESTMTDGTKSEVSGSLRGVQGVNRVWLEGHRRGRPIYDPRRDPTLSSRLAPDSLTATERQRIRGGFATNRDLPPTGAPQPAAAGAPRP